jgi:hypothetical protein
MKTFIEDYLEWVPELVGDPAGGKRFSTSSLMRDLYSESCVIYEDLLRVSSAESVLGYTESVIKIENDKEFYSLPGNFRQFVRLERRVGASASDCGDPDDILDRLGTVPVLSRDRGIVISDVERGFRITPVPTIDDEQWWTLCYQRGPARLHWGTGEVLSANFFRMPASVLEQQGEIISTINYYSGTMLHILEDPTQGVREQFAEITSGGPVANGTLEYATRSSLNKGRGTAKYEIRPFLPPGLDKLIAVCVALARCAPRANVEVHSLLVRERKKYFNAARQWFRTTTQDRPPTLPSRGLKTVDPMAM